MADLVTRPNRTDANTTAGKLANDANVDRDAINILENRRANIREDVNDLQAAVADLKGRTTNVETKTGKPGPKGATGATGPAGKDGVVSTIQNAAGQDKTSATVRFGAGFEVVKDGPLTTVKATGGTSPGGGSGGTDGEGNTVGGTIEAVIESYDPETFTAQATYNGTSYPTKNATGFTLKAGDGVYAYFLAGAEPTTLVAWKLWTRDGETNPTGGGGKEAITGLGYPIVFNNSSSYSGDFILQSPSGRAFAWNEYTYNAGRIRRIIDGENVSEVLSYNSTAGMAATVVEDDGTLIITSVSNNITTMLAKPGSTGASTVTVGMSNGTFPLAAYLRSAWVDTDGTITLATVSNPVIDGSKYYRLAQLPKTTDTFRATLVDDDRGLWTAAGITAAQVNVNGSYPAVLAAKSTTSHHFAVVAKSYTETSLVTRPVDGSANWTQVATGLSTADIDGIRYGTANGNRVVWGTKQTFTDGDTLVDSLGWRSVNAAGEWASKADLTPITVADGGFASLGVQYRIEDQVVPVSATKTAVVQALVGNAPGETGADPAEPRVAVWLIDDNGGALTRQLLWVSPPGVEGIVSGWDLDLKGTAASKSGDGSWAVFFSALITGVNETSQSVSRQLLWKVVIPSGGGGSGEW